jgi:predicted transcriptional regulator of viral defense system
MKLIEKNGGVVRTKDAVAAGTSRTVLSNLVQAGVLTRIARGQYVLTDTFPDDLHIWQQRMKLIVYSHETALFLHGMAERTPAVYSVTIPSNVKISPTFPVDLKVYYVKPELYNMGVVFAPSMMGHEVRTYDIERTICDVLRSRNRIDSQTVSHALRSYMALRHKDLNRLREYAESFRVTRILRQYMEVLL